MKICSFQHSNFVYIRNSLPIADAQCLPCWMHDLRRGRQCLTAQVNHVLVKLLPLFSQLCLKVIDITNVCAVHTLLRYAIAGVHRGTKYLCWTPLYSILLGHGWASERASGLLKYSDELLAWLSVWSEVQMICTWSSWFTATPPSLASLKSRMIYLSDASFVATKRLESSVCTRLY